MECEHEETMMKNTGKRLLFWAASIGLAALPIQAETVPLITDGGFENGAAGWFVTSTADPQDAGWGLGVVGQPTPISFQETSAEGGGENIYAIADQAIVSTMALYQPFTVPAGATSVKFGFDMFVNDYALQLGVNPDQVVRVDIMEGNASPLDQIGVFNAFLGNAGGPLPSPFASYEFEVLPLLETDREYIVRFYANVGVAILNVGVDNVYVNAEFVPEPSAGSLGLIGLLGGIAARRRRTRHT